MSDPNDARGDAPRTPDRDTGSAWQGPWPRDWRGERRGPWVGRLGGSDSGRDAAWWARLGPAERFPWLGALLVVVGIALLLRELLGVSILGLTLLALGLAFAAVWLVARGRWALVPALVLLAIAAARLLTDVGWIRGEGWTPLFLGLALVVAWILRRGRRSDWLLWGGALLALVGVTQVSDQLPGVPDLSAVWPLVLVAAGIALLTLASFRRSRVS